MPSTQHKSLEERIKFACRASCLLPEHVKEVARRMKKANPGVELLDPRQFGGDARKAMSEMWADQLGDEEV